MVRIKMQLQRRWVELVNDFVWVISALMPSTLFFSVAISIFDAFIAGLQALLEIERLKELQREFRQTRSNDVTSEEGHGNNIASQQYLKRCLSHEQKKLLLRIINIISITALVILKSSLPVLVPTLAINPILPLVIASLVVAITVLCQLLSKWLDSQKPSSIVTKIADLSKSEKSAFSTKLTFFSSKEGRGPTKSKSSEKNLSLQGPHSVN